METKRCFKCKKTLPLTDFYENQQDCKPCQKVYRQAYYKRNKKRMFKQAQAWRKANPEKTRGYVQKHYRANIREKRTTAIANYHRRQAVKSGDVYDADITIGKIRIRDGTICPLCNKHVPWGRNH